MPADPPTGGGAGPAAAGWEQRADEGFPALVGPLWSRREGALRAYGIIAEPRHTNVHGIVHGGMLMTLADTALGLNVWEEAGRQPSVTVQLDVQFLAVVRPGEFVEARAEILRRTRSVIFVRGALAVGGRSVAAASGVWKLLGTA